MKYSYLAALLCTFSVAKVSAQSFHIDAHLNLDDDTLYVNCDPGYQRDTIVGSKGVFSLDIPMKEISSISISNKYFPMPDDKAIRFVALPDERVELQGNYSYFQIKGSHFYEEYDKMRLMLQGNENILHTNIAWSNLLRENKIEHDSLTSIFFTVRKEAENTTQEAAEQYMLLHPDEECSALLFDKIRDVHVARKCYDALSERVRNGRMAPVMAKYLEHVDGEISRLERAVNIQPDKPAPLFALKDLKGKTVRLEKLRGQWLILDFWGSWCFWCLNGVPEMREYYNKYKGKFQILSIDCYDKATDWKTAVEKNNMPWMHVTDPTPSNATGSELENSIVYRYAISGFPTKVIVRPDGNIERVFVGEKEEFYQYLDKLFK